MKLAQVISKAKKMEIKDAAKMSKIDLIRTIQTKEGYTPCFAPGKKNCGEKACLWREDCVAS
jgi:hypothetical protein